MIGKDYSNLQVGDKVKINRFYYATPQRTFEGEVVGLTKRFVKVKFEADYSDMGRIYQNTPKQVVTLRFRKQDGHEPHSGYRSAPPPSYWLA